MADNAPQPMSGSLSARLIRACREHAQCPLDCPSRQVEDLGELASFDNRPMVTRIKDHYNRWRSASGPKGDTPA